MLEKLTVMPPPRPAEAVSSELPLVAWRPGLAACAGRPLDVTVDERTSHAVDRSTGPGAGSVRVGWRRYLAVTGSRDCRSADRPRPMPATATAA